MVGPARGDNAKRNAEARTEDRQTGDRGLREPVRPSNRYVTRGASLSSPRRFADMASTEGGVVLPVYRLCADLEVSTTDQSGRVSGTTQAAQHLEVRRMARVPARCRDYHRIVPPKWSAVKESPVCANTSLPGADADRECVHSAQ